ncbi:EamA family transporter RarD [Sneathiella limimaris]|uniref:EamA family transporter RarD n=1 Tax=Sneathiella limimaris TaxID=1964213 RepID=UPI00146AA03D|nr:EamA family transporter RarD [Sneathiella limimaris]
MTKIPANSGSEPHGLPDKEKQKGLLAALATFGMWGVFPLYFKALSHVPVLEVLANRILWSLVLVSILILATGRLEKLRLAITNRSVMKYFIGSTLLIAANWTTFLWAVVNDRVLEASLGYYINPLVSVALGMIFLGERLNRWQSFAIFLAICSVSLMTIMLGQLPWVSLVLAFSFGFYGLLRKKVEAESTIGLSIETGLLVPFSLGYIIFLSVTDGLQGGALGDGFYSIETFLLLAGTGFVTGVPLILFSYGAQRLRLSTVGLMQYIAPTIQVILAVFVFKEQFSFIQLSAFSLIWAGLLVYSIDGYRNRS